jgi:5-methylcytosine-specific restriction endonuclease McrA
MRRFEYGRFETSELHPRVVAALALERGGKADVIGLLGEIVSRRTFVDEGFDDPKDYCMRALGMSTDQAARRLRAARTAHEFPALLPAVADGRLGVTAVNTLGPHLTTENCVELIALAAGRTIEEIEGALRERLAPVPAPMLERIEDSGSQNDEMPNAAVVPLAPAPVSTTVVCESAQAMEPVFVAPAPVVRRVAITAEAQEKLEYARALLSHVTRDEGKVLERALDALISKLEAKKFAKTDRPGRQRPSANPRHIPANVKRVVYERDEGRCTFVGDHGHRCETRNYLQFDHIITVAEGGLPTEDNLRLRCRAHNQLEAERRFGKAFMERKRTARREALAPRRETSRTKALAPELVAKRNDLLAALRTLGYSAREANCAAANCADRLGLSLDGLVIHALAYLAPPNTRRSGALAPAPAPAT